MVTLAGIQKQIADLEKQASAIFKAECSAAIAKVKELIAKYNLSAEDVGLGAKAGKKAASVAAKREPAAPRPKGIARYRDPKSGKTWTGVGKAPGWIAGAKNRDKFLIAAAPAAAAVQPAPQAASSAAGRRAKAVAKPAAKSDPVVPAAGASKRAARKTTAPAPAAGQTPPLKKAAARKSAARKNAAGAQPAGATPAEPAAAAPADGA